MNLSGDVFCFWFEWSEYWIKFMMLFSGGWSSQCMPYSRIMNGVNAITYSLKPSYKRNQQPTGKWEKTGVVTPALKTNLFVWKKV